MSLVKFKGKLITKEMDELPSGVIMMKVLFKEINDNTKINTEDNYYEVLVYGREIHNYFLGWDNNRPDPICEVTANLTGRIKVNKTGKQYNNLTLIHKNIKYIYEQRN